MRQLTLIQLGIGTVGGALIEQAIANRAGWRQRLGLEVMIGVVIGREGALIAADGALSEETLRAAVAGRRSGDALGRLAERGSLTLAPPEEAATTIAGVGSTILIDAAAGEFTAALDVQALDGGAGVVLSNKAPLALPFADAKTQSLWDATGPAGRLRYEATCGAGLPVLSTLRSLLDTSDDILEIQGALSGTLGAIFSDVATGHPFSAAVRSARERGYTEPDPRDDLSGLDVARKALILARTIGRQVDLTDIAVESLVPAHLADVSVEEFLAQVGDLDAEMAERAARAQAAGQALKYVATIPAAGPLAVGVQPISTGGVLGALQGPENIISIRTRRYDTYPLVISGPGAGAEVTAAGMLADVLTLAPR